MFKHEIIESFKEGRAIAIDASAGTGKTHFIGQSVKTLLEEGLDIRNLLIVTFTENAAQEIKHRIRTLLLESKNDASKPAEYRDLFSRAVENYDQATVTTIHGFMNGIIGAEPLLFNLPVQINVSKNEQKQTRSVILRYVEWFLNSPEHSGLLKTIESLPVFVSDKGRLNSFVEPMTDYIEEILNKNYDDEDLFLNDFKNYWMSNEKLASLNSHLTEGSKEIFALLRSIEDSILSNPDGKELKKAFGKTSDIVRRSKIVAIDGVLRNSLDKDNPSFWLIYLMRKLDLDKLGLIANLGNPTFDNNSKPTGNECFLAYLPGIFGPPRENFFSLDFEDDEGNIDSVKALKTCLDLIKIQTASVICQKVRVHTKAERSRSGEVNFQDMIDLMFAATNNEKLLSNLRNRYKAVLVDEFQDTDRKQFSVFEKAFLNRKEPNTLFLMVGDPKQAIYGFRGADQNVFNAAKQKILGNSGTQLTLKHNYRAHESLIEATNSLFATASAFFAAKTESESSWEFTKSEAPSPSEELAKSLAQVNPELLTRPIEIVGFNKDQLTPNPRKNALNYLASEIVSLSQAGVNLASICVLVDTNAHAQAVIRRLRRANIPFKMRGKTSLESSPYVDFYVFLSRALASIDDEAALSYLTNFPLFSNDELHAYLKPLIFELRKAYRNAGMIGLAQRLIAEKEGLIETLEDKNRHVSDIWQIAELLHKGGADGLMPPSELGQFADRFKKSLSTSEKNALFLEDMQDAVSVMTVHGSKGLGYDFVFYYQPRLKSKDDQSKLFEYDLDVVNEGNRERRQAVSVLDDFEPEAKYKFWHGNLNLSYVALTRAKLKQYFVIAAEKEIDANYLCHLLIGKVPNIAEAASKLDLDCTEITSWISVNPSVTVRTLTPSPSQAPEIGASSGDRVKLISALEGFLPKKRHPYALSYSRLAPTKDSEAPKVTESKKAPETSLPAGANFGSFVHQVIEDFDGSVLRAVSQGDESRDKIVKLAERFAVAKKIDDWYKVFQAQLRRVLDLKLPHTGASVFDLMTKANVRVKKELPFTLHLKPQSDYSDYYIKANSLSGRALGLTKDIRVNSGFLNGVIDFAAFDGNEITIIDWKTNLLTEDEEAGLEAYMKPPHSSYKLQAYIYALALQKAFPKHTISGVYYIFTRTPSLYDLGPEVAVLEDLEHQLRMGPYSQSQGGIAWI